jgi:hypothetical protein
VGSGIYLTASTTAVSAPPVAGSEITFTQVDNSIGDAVAQQSLWTFFGDSSPSIVFSWYICSNPISTRPTSLPSGCTFQWTPEHTLVNSGQKYSTIIQVQPEMIGKYLLVSSRATNSAGTATKWSLGTSKILGVPALNSNPYVTGSSTVGNLMTAATGTWLSDSEITFAYQWYQCAIELPYGMSSVANYSCSLIPSATSSTYTTTSADQGLHVTAKVSASNVIGNGIPMFIGSVGIAGLPGFTTGPLVTGTTTKASTLTSEGVVSGYPAPTRTHAWYRCSSEVSAVASTLPSGCVAIASATSSTYTIVDADISSYISVLQTLTNSAGTTTRWSASTTQIAGAPVNTAVPTITGSTMAGQVLTADVGTWRGTPTPTYSYEWYVCTTYLPNGQANTVPVNCTAIPSATGSTYTVSQIYYGKGLSVRITATNSAGSTSYMSVGSPTVESLPFTITEPYIWGTATVGNMVNVFAGTWVGYTPPSTTYRWYRCTTSQSSISTSLPADCSLIPSRTAQSYRVDSADLGKYLVAEVIGTNNKGSVSRWTVSTSDVNQIPDLNTEAVISGTPSSGSTLSVTPGSWSATPTATLSYKWMRCTQQNGFVTISKPANCSEISGEVSTSYTLTSADVGKYISIQETATNSAGSAIRFTATTAIVTG